MPLNDGVTHGGSPSTRLTILPLTPTEAGMSAAKTRSIKR